MAPGKSSISSRAGQKFLGGPGPVSGSLQKEGGRIVTQCRHLTPKTLLKEVLVSAPEPEGGFCFVLADPRCGRDHSVGMPGIHLQDDLIRSPSGGPQELDAEGVEPVIGELRSQQLNVPGAKWKE